ncbi:MAG: hypothetical protein HQ557_06660 [Bacteroidetes bacterium]|nr:hypothetical protein [Bacteroidota bacterium]
MINKKDKIMYALSSFPARGGLGIPCTNCLVNEAKVNLQYPGEEAGHLCQDCYNREISEIFGVPFFDDYDKQVRLYRVDGSYVDFTISYMLFYPHGAKWTALSLEENLEFAMHGSPIDPEDALRELKLKVGRGMNTQSLNEQGSLNNSGWMRIECDPDNRERTIVVIDRKSFTIVELAQKLQTYEGWMMKFEFVEPSEAFPV